MGTKVNKKTFLVGPGLAKSHFADSCIEYEIT
jgi:hypothetical protein